MSAEESAQIVRRYVSEVWNNGNFEVLTDLIATDHVRHDPSGDSNGVDELQARIEGFRAAFPDLHFDINVHAANDDGITVTRRWTMTGTHRGDYAGIAATGTAVTNTGIAISRFENGKIAEEWIQRDDLGLLRELGAI